MRACENCCEGFDLTIDKGSDVRCLKTGLVNSFDYVCDYYRKITLEEIDRRTAKRFKETEDFPGCPPGCECPTDKGCSL